MLKTLVAAVACLLATATIGAAQSPEIFVGYTNLQGEGLPNRNDPAWVFDTDFFRDRTTLHGINASITGYNEVGIGLTGDFSWARRSQSEDFTGGTDTAHTDTYYFLGGPAVKFARGSRVQPFARLMAGFAYNRFKGSREFDSSVGTPSNSFVVGATDFAASVGGGLDVSVGERTKIRVFQLDYAPIFLRDRTVEVLGGSGVIQPTTLNGQRQDNFRFSIGVTF
jgi:opacity protein-like surface antigen